MRSHVTRFWEQENEQTGLVKSKPEIRELYEQAGMERKEIKGEDGSVQSVVEGQERQSAREYARAQLAQLQSAMERRGGSAADSEAAAT
jgi:hypothetical protein